MGACTQAEEELIVRTEVGRSTARAAQDQELMPKIVLETTGARLAE